MELLLKIMSAISENPQEKIAIVISMLEKNKDGLFTFIVWMIGVQLSKQHFAGYHSCRCVSHQKAAGCLFHWEIMYRNKLYLQIWL